MSRHKVGWMVADSCTTKHEGSAGTNNSKFYEQCVTMPGKTLRSTVDIYLPHLDDLLVCSTCLIIKTSHAMM